MAQFKNLQNAEAQSLWGDFVVKSSELIPFSFNPSLYHFYIKHYNWEPYYFLIYKNYELCGLFPLVNTGNAWVSLPHFSYGGALFKKNCEPSISSGLIDHLVSEIKSSQLNQGFYKFEMDKNQFVSPEMSDKIFIRSLNKMNDEKFVKSEKLTSLLELPSGKDGLSELISANLNRKIRKATKTGISVKNGKLELLDDFYKIYSRSIYKLKSLNYSKRFCQDMFSTYEFGELEFFVAYKNNLPVGCSLLASYNGFYENMYFAVSAEFRKYFVSDLLHWDMINFSIEKNKIPENRKNQAVYSFGRSTASSGVHLYKSHWPVKDFPLYNYSNIIDIRKQKWKLKLWGLLPYTIAKPLGARLIKDIY